MCLMCSREVGMKMSFSIEHKQNQVGSESLQQALHDASH